MFLQIQINFPAPNGVTLDLCWSYWQQSMTNSFLFASEETDSQEQRGRQTSTGASYRCCTLQPKGGCCSKQAPSCFKILHVSSAWHKSLGIHPCTAALLTWGHSWKCCRVFALNIAAKAIAATEGHLEELASLDKHSLLVVLKTALVWNVLEE